MGWDSCDAWKKKSDVVAEQTRVGRYSGGCLLAKKSVRDGLWLVWELHNGERFIEFNLIEKSRGSYSVKSMSEAMGPYYFDCPLAFLDMVSKPEGMTFPWRAHVRQFHASKNRASTPMKTVVVRPNLFTLLGIE